jgi:hypothetical protein
MGSITPGMTGSGFGGGLGGGYTPSLPTMAPSLNNPAQPQITAPNFNALPGASSQAQPTAAPTPDINALLQELTAGAGAAQSSPGMQAQPSQLPITPSPGPTAPMFGCGQKLNRLA